MIFAMLMLAADPIEFYTEDQHDCSAELVRDNELRLTAEDIESAQMSFNEQTSQPVINLEFSERGNMSFLKVQKGRIGKNIPLCFNGVLLADPILNEVIVSGKVQISGRFTVEEATKLAVKLNSDKPTN